jgi:hypothetical protein
MITGSLLYGNRQNKSFENVAELRCLGTTITDGIYIHIEVQRRLNLQTVRFNLVGIFLPLIWKHED